MPKQIKIFLDSSALISGLNSPVGAAGVIIFGFSAGEFLIHISGQIIEEIQRNIFLKFPSLKEPFLDFLLNRPVIVKQPSLKEIRKAYQLIETNDAPILAAAIKTKPDFLITWDIKHFLKKKISENVSFIICTPKEFLQKYWQPAYTQK